MTCSVCGKEFDKKEVGRIYGINSGVYAISVCSSFCFTEKINLTNSIINLDGDLIQSMLYDFGKDIICDNNLDIKEWIKNYKNKN